LAISNTEIFRKGIWIENPVLRHVLGICSTLAVTNLVINTLVMNAGLIFTLAMSSLTVSLLRNYTPSRIRMMVQMLVISSYVIIVDILIKAHLPDISESLGPYVGLIITNCFVLLIIALFRETLGFGTIMGFRIMPADFVPWTIMIMAPGAFFMLGIFIWIVRARYPEIYEEKA
jgi:Na+-transporting NADH:ubiquinone oxidoreductase subunit D